MTGNRWRVRKTPHGWAVQTPAGTYWHTYATWPYAYRAAEYFATHRRGRHP